MGKGFTITARAAESTEKSFSSLSKITLAISIKLITEYVTARVAVNNKLANGSESNQLLADVTSRVLVIAQFTKSDLQSTVAVRLIAEIDLTPRTEL